MFNFDATIARATAGEAEAQHALGCAYHYGLSGVPRDLSKAQHWYEAAAAQEHAEAILNLGVLQLVDLPKAGGTRDAAKALQHFEHAAALGNALAMFNAGELLSGGNGLAREFQKALEWYVKAAQAGNTAALNRLGLLAQTGEDVPLNLLKAADCFRRGAERGDATCQYNLSLCYLQGQGVPKDVTLAYPWMLKAAEQGDAQAQYNVGAIHCDGLIGEPDLAAAHVWWEKAAAQDDPNALYRLGLCYHQGNGVAVDEMTARVFYRRATELGHVAATYSFAWMIEHGIMHGTAMQQAGDPAMAAGWYARAARGGHPMAANNLGMLYAQGIGVGHESDTARNLFEYAISCGEDSAMFNLGLLLYRGGPGLAPDMVEAMKWGLLSLHHHPQGNAQKLLEAMAPKMTVEQIDEAQTRAGQWQRTTKTLLWTEQRLISQADKSP